MTTKEAINIGIKFVLFFLVCVAVIAWLTGCTVLNGNSVVSGTAVDTVTAVEHRVNGAYYVWLLHDPTTAFCTIDQVVADQASALNGHVASLTYAGINAGDKDAKNPITNAGCEKLDTVQVLRLTAVSAFTPDAK